MSNHHTPNLETEYRTNLLTQVETRIEGFWHHLMADIKEGSQPSEEGVLSAQEAFILMFNSFETYFAEPSPKDLCDYDPAFPKNQNICNIYGQGIHENHSMIEYTLWRSLYRFLNRKLDLLENPNDIREKCVDYFSPMDSDNKQELIESLIREKERELYEMLNGNKSTYGAPTIEPYYNALWLALMNVRGSLEDIEPTTFATVDERNTYRTKVLEASKIIVMKLKMLFQILLPKRNIGLANRITLFSPADYGNQTRGQDLPPSAYPAGNKNRGNGNGNGNGKKGEGIL